MKLEIKIGATVLASIKEKAIVKKQKLADLSGRAVDHKSGFGLNTKYENKQRTFKSLQQININGYNE